MPARTDQAKVSVIRVLNQVVISVKYRADGSAVSAEPPAALPATMLPVAAS
jgi:hypothetical protein